MSQPSRGYQRFFAELKRRKVFRVAAVYGATAFVVLQGAQLLAVGLDLPGWVFRAVTLLAIVGFPIALVLAWAFETTPEGVRRTEAAAPEEVEAIVAQPASKRWPSGVLALLGVVLLVAGAWWVGRRSGPGAPEPALEASIAVLPFVDMSPAGDQEYFSDGIAEELLNLLARVRGLRVAARTSSFAFEGDDLPVPVIAESLNVAHVLEGSVRKAGDEVRITAQLIRAEDGYHVWSQTWDRTLEDVFAVQDEIASDVVERLRVTLLDEAPTVEETDPEAYALVLQARHLSERGGEANLERAEALYREALALDSAYAAGWSGLAVTYIRQAGGEGHTASGRPHDRARAAAERARSIDPQHAPAHAALGFLAIIEGDLADAARHYERSVRLAPGDARTLGRAGIMLMALGRLEQSVRVLEYHVARDPVNPIGHMNLATAYLATGRPDRAVESLRTATALGPDVRGLHANLGQALLQAGEPEAALAEIRKAPRGIWRLIAEAMAYHALGRADDSDEALAALIEAHERDAAFNIAYVVAFRGEIDRAFAWLERAVRYDDPGLSEVFVRPEFDALKDDPRWDPFLERIGRSPEDLEAIDFEVELPGPAGGPPGSS